MCENDHDRGLDAIAYGMLSAEIEERHRYMREIFKIDVTWIAGVWTLNTFGVAWVTTPRLHNDIYFIHGLFIFINFAAVVGIARGYFNLKASCAKLNTRTQQVREGLPSDIVQVESAVPEERMTSFFVILCVVSLVLALSWSGALIAKATGRMKMPPEVTVAEPGKLEAAPKGE